MNQAITGHPPASIAPAAESRLWRDAALAFAVLFIVTLFAAMTDDRMLNGVSVWTKPLKFQASLALHFASLVLLAKLLPAARRSGAGFRALVTASTAAGLFEIGYIMLQAARGRASHFNDETVIEAVMYVFMGIGAVVLVVAPFVLGVWLWRSHGKSWQSDPLWLGGVAGLILPAVLTLVVAGYMSSTGGHWVGPVTTDAGGLPLVGWSRQVGDLRVPHFFASHGLQFLPLLGLALRGRGRGGSLGVMAATVVWLLFTVAVFLQALSGQPFLALD